MAEQIAADTTNSIPLNGSATAASLPAPDPIPDDNSDKPSSYRVLEREMLFWHDKGEEIYNLILEFLKDHQNLHNRNNANLITQVAKALADHKSKAVDAAAKLAAYQLPKLQAIDINQSTTHKFVVLAPPLIPDTNKWLEAVNQAPPRQISNDAILAQLKDKSNG